MQSLQRLGRRMGLPLDFNLGEEGRGRVMRASILPAFFLANQLVALVLDLYYSDGELFIFFDDSAPELWQRVRRLISSTGRVSVLPADYSQSAISSSRTEASDRLRGEGLHDGSVASLVSQRPLRWTGPVSQSSAYAAGTGILKRSQSTRTLWRSFARGS